MQNLVTLALKVTEIKVFIRTKKPKIQADKYSGIKTLFGFIKPFCLILLNGYKI